MAFDNPGYMTHQEVKASAKAKDDVAGPLPVKEPLDGAVSLEPPNNNNKGSEGTPTNRFENPMYERSGKKANDHYDTLPLVNNKRNSKSDA